MLNYFRKKIFDKRAKILNLKKSSKFKIQDKRAKILNLKKSSKFISNKFNYLDFEYKSYGKKNPNKFFFVIRRTPGAGFFSNLNFVLHNLYICEKLKMIPIIDMENYHTLYNCRVKIDNSKNAWNYYYKSVSNYNLDEVYQSKNVFICDNRASNRGFIKDLKKSKFKYFHGFQYLDIRHKKIFQKYIKIQEEFLDISKKFVDKNFKNKKILGVCFRGSDQKKSGYHPYTPTEKQMQFVTNFLIKKYNFDKIFICTEDIDYLNFYKKKYGEKVLYSDSIRTTDKVDLFDSEDIRHRYKIGRGNLIDMLILSKTNHILFATSNIPYAAIFYSGRKIPHSLIDNGMQGNIFISQISWYIKKNLPSFLGGFKNEFKSFDL